MSVPEFQTIMRPALVALEDGQPRTLRALRAVIAGVLNLSEDDQTELLASGKQTRYSNRVAWAMTHMAKAGLVERPARGEYTISPRVASWKLDEASGCESRPGSRRRAR